MPRTAHILSFRKTLQKSVLHDGFGKKPIPGRLNPRPAGVFSRTRPAGGGADSAPLPNSRTNRRSEAGEAAIESPERENSNAH